MRVVEAVARAMIRVVVVAWPIHVVTARFAYRMPIVAGTAVR